MVKEEVAIVLRKVLAKYGYKTDIKSSIFNHPLIYFWLHTNIENCQFLLFFPLPPQFWQLRTFKTTSFFNFEF
jgi:hypothetical protein